MHIKLLDLPIWLLLYVFQEKFILTWVNRFQDCPGPPTISKDFLVLENARLKFKYFPGLSRTSYHFQGLSSPGKCYTKIQVLSRIVQEPYESCSITHENKNQMTLSRCKKIERFYGYGFRMLLVASTWCGEMTRLFSETNIGGHKYTNVVFILPWRFLLHSSEKHVS